MNVEHGHDREVVASSEFGPHDVAAVLVKRPGKCLRFQ